MKKVKKTTTIKNGSSLAAQFEQERMRLLNRAVAIGATLAAVLVPLFSLLDIVFKPNVFWLFFIIRLSVTLASIAVYFLTKTPFGIKNPYPLGVFLTIIVGGSIALMCHLDMGPSDPYYAGINLPLLGFGILLPLLLKEGILVFGIVWLIYFIPNFFVLQSHEVKIFVSNNFFMISTIIISLAASQFHLYQRRAQWHTHRKLQSAHRKIKNHAKELEEKVQERTQRLLQSERLAVVGQLAGGIAHDFNNILTAILGISQLITDSLSEKNPIRQDIESISRAGKRAVDLVKQLLAFSRRQILISKVLNLNDVISEIREMLARVIGEDIELIVRTQPDLGNILTDPVQIEQIILNLSVNARDAMSNGGKLIIKTANVTLDKTYCKSGKITLPPGEYVMLAVSDTGEGMDKEVKAKIFEPFFTTKEKGQGTGLGLSSVYGIVKQSNGDITVYSEEGKGTTLKIYLPRVMEPTEKPRKKTNNRRKLPTGKETILLVEDENEVRHLTARLLEKQGYKVMQAEEGRAALSLSEQYDGSIDLLVSDVIMPHMNGKVLAERLLAQRSDLKVLFISGHINSIIAQSGIFNISSAFLQKPYTIENLSNKIRDIFDN